MKGWCISPRLPHQLCGGSPTVVWNEAISRASPLSKKDVQFPLLCDAPLDLFCGKVCLSTRCTYKCILAAPRCLCRKPFEVHEALAWAHREAFFVSNERSCVEEKQRRRGRESQQIPLFRRAH
ncbi:unnamed protein product, partial [Hapterophycus canaliculatus]